MNTYVLKTLGCKANLYDSQLIEAELQRRGWTPAGEGQKGLEEGLLSARLCIVNSCTVTDEADRQSRKLASRLGRDNPRARVVVTGCGAEVDPERLAKSAGIHYVVGNQDKPKMVDLILRKLESEANAPALESGLGEILGGVSGYEQMLSRHPMDREWPAVEVASTPTEGTRALEGFAAKTRAFLKIQEGCNSFCTYCVIPYGRGPSRSMKPREVIDQIRNLVVQGAREVVITGTNIGDYGVDWGLSPVEALPELFSQILSETALERLRVGSLDPVEISPALTALVEREPRFCAHFHVSLQAAHSKILRLMKRKYGMTEVRECLERIARLPGHPFIGMDVITGFPGEGTEEFEQGLEALSLLPWSRLHVFPYSERSGTPATRLPGSVSPAERVKRARALQALSLERVTKHVQNAGESLTGVLLERPQIRPPHGWATRTEEARRLAGLKDSDEPLVWASGYTAQYLRAWIPMSQESAARQRNFSVNARPFEMVIDPPAGEAAWVAHLD